MTLPDCTIHRVSVLQADDVFSLVEEYYDAVQVVVRDTRETLRHYLADAATGVWLAYCGTSPVGCILYHSLPEIADAGEVKRLYVRPLFRHRGIAQQLLENLEQFAVVAGVQWLYLDTKDDMPVAIAFYELNGFVRCPRYNNNSQATIFMRKRLVTGRPSAAGQ
jgi:GNAT superfamily N-acetyltransferase